jgi:acetolactate synthase-1/2/3 large subunit
VSIESAERPVILVDDYLLRSPMAERDLARFATRLGAPVLQVAYRRGPMFFQQLRSTTVPTFLGLFDPRDAQHRALLEEADLVVTLEDRNMYPRVVGRLPDCRKVAITSHRAATVKNGYLRSSDVLVVGETLAILRGLTERLAGPERRPLRDTGSVSVRAEPSAGDLPVGGASDGHSASSDEFARAVARGLHAVPSVVIVDDSQMFGGVLARNYRHLPASVRIFASHGGFVGGGLATAAGLALAHPDVAVVVTLGDQGFTNGVQALAAVRAQRIPLLVLVCNNGSSVSLTTQAAADGVDADRVASVLGNAAGLGYAAVARGFGIPATTQVWTGDPTGHGLEAASRRLTAGIADALRAGGPGVLELVTPDSPQFWAGVWRVAGSDEPVQAPPQPGPVRDGSVPRVVSRAATSAP